jgi:hypothetical protein
MITPKHGHASAVVDNNLLFVVGGENSNVVEKLDIREGKWTSCSNLKTLR